MTRKQPNNPLIETLGEIPTGNDLVNALIRRPSFDPAERKHPSRQRIHYLDRLKKTLCPNPEYVRYCALFDRIIRAGYEQRRDLVEGNQLGLYTSSPGIIRGDPDVLIKVDGSCILLAGVTGAGKSTLVKLVCLFYPLVIDHGTITKGRLQLVQIPTLYVRLPVDGSLKSFARAFFGALDERLQLHQFYGKCANKTSLNTTELTTAISQACKTHAIGVIVFDQFEDLAEASTKSNRTVVNYLIFLRDTIGVPLVYVGTFPMLKLFEYDGRSARRSAQGGGVLIPRITDPSDQLWKVMCDAYWDCQWVRKPMKITPGIRNKLFRLSQGVPDYLHQVYARGQELAIESGAELIDEEILQEAFDERCPQLHAAVAALRSNKLSSIRSFPDLSHPWVEARSKKNNQAA